MTPLLALVLGGALGTVFTVDDDGPADFSTIHEAVAAASDGDTIVVHSGSYPPFQLDKDLTILGHSGGPLPEVAGPVLVHGTSDFHLARLEIEALRVAAAAGGLDHMVIRGTDSAPDGFKVLGGSEVLVQRSKIVGETTDLGGGAGAVVVDSLAWFVECEIVGAHGDLGLTTPGNPGGHGLLCEQSEVYVAASALVGGPAGGGPFAPGGCSFGDGGDALRAVQSFVSLRGRPFDPLVPGRSGPPQCGGAFGRQARLLDHSTLLWSGVLLLDVDASADSQVHHPDPFEPFLRNDGSTAPGSQGALLLHGPPGEVAVLLGSFDTNVTHAIGVDGPFGFDPNLWFFVGTLQTQGNLQPALCPYPVPSDPALVGMRGRYQAFFPMLPGAIYVRTKRITNPVEILPVP